VDTAGLYEAPRARWSTLAALAEPRDSAEELQAEDLRPLPVLAEAHPIERAQPASLPAVVAAATGGFLIGVATFVLVRILRRPRPARLRVGRRAQKVDVAGTRSFLVDIHLLRDR
jgi:hypothetical protein